MKSFELNKNNILITLLVIFIPAVIYLRDIKNIPINKYLIVMVIAFAALIFLNLRNIVILSCYIIPFLSGLPGNYIIVILSIAIIIKTKLKINMKILITLIILITLELISLTEVPFSWVEYIMYIFHYIFILIIVSIPKNKIDNKKNIVFFALGTFITLVLILMNSLTIVDFSQFFDPAYRFGNITDLKQFGSNTMILTHDQNFIGYLCIVSISSLIIVIKYSKSNRIVNIFLLISLVFFGLLTISRAFMVVLGSLLLFYIINSLIYEKSYKKLTTIFLTIFIFFIIYAIISKFFPWIIESFSKRFSEGDVLGGRGTINQYYINFALDNSKYLLIGTGCLSMLFKSGYSHTIHNATLQIFVSYGIIGSLVYFIWYFELIKEEVLAVKKRVVFESMIPHLLGLVIIQSIPFINPYYGMLPLLITLFAFRENDNIVEKM